MKVWNTRRPLGRAALVLGLAVIVAGTLAARPAAAQPPEDGCDPSEAIACLALPDDEDDVPGSVPSSAPSSGPATASPRVPQPPMRCPPFAAAEPSIAAPLPPLPGCDRRGVVATVNRANVLYARALRTLSVSELPAVWADDALVQVEGYVATLSATGRYATPELRTIQLLDLRVEGATARARTIENWLYQERDRLAGRILLHENQWVENIYDLQRRGGAWLVVRNDVFPAAQPLPVRPVLPSPPAQPPSPPCILIYPPPPGCESSPPASPAPGAALTVSTDRDGYRIGDTVVATLTNTGTTTVVGGGGYRCGFVNVEVARDDGDEWVPAPGGAEICTAIGILLRPGETRTERFAAGPDPGRYRLMVRVSLERDGFTTVYSDPYSVEP